MGKNKKALSKKEQAALKTASAKRVAEQEEGPRIPRKAPKNTGRTRAATTEDVLADMAGQDSETDDSEDEEDAADEDHGSVNRTGAPERGKREGRKDTKAQDGGTGGTQGLDYGLPGGRRNGKNQPGRLLIR